MFSTIILSILILAVSLNDARHHHHHHHFENVIQDAFNQSTHQVSCWEKGLKKTAAFKLSEEIYDYCMYSVNVDTEIIVVSGITETVDEDVVETSVRKMFSDGALEWQMLTICVQEASKYPIGVAISTRCYCKRNACNMPVGMETFWKFNGEKIPALEF